MFSHVSTCDSHEQDVWSFRKGDPQGRVQFSPKIALIRPVTVECMKDTHRRTLRPFLNRSVPFLSFYSGRLYRGLIISRALTKRVEKRPQYYWNHTGSA